MSDSLQPHGRQHTRSPSPLPTPGVYSNSCPLSRWCHPTISSSVIPFSSHLQSFPASGSFQMSQFFTWGGHSIRVSASASVLPMNIQDWFPLGWTGWISLQSVRNRYSVFAIIPTITRQHIKKQRHYFVNKSLVKAMVFPVVIYGCELDCKESWAQRNWCFWTVVLEKTLETPLDSKEIQPVHPKGNQSWIFIGRSDAEAETLILWPPDAKNWLIQKDPDAGNDWRWEDDRGRDGWMSSLTLWTWVWVSSRS